MKAQTITILGLGRTGASVALAIKAAQLNVSVIGYDEDDERKAQAREAGAIDKGEGGLLRAAAAGDIVVIAVPDAELEGVLRAIGQDVREHALVLSLGGLKKRSQQWAGQHLAQGHYVGAVAVLAAGAVQRGAGGVDEARADLFRNSVFCLMPSPDAAPQAVETAVNLGALLGAKPFFVDGAEYDSLALAVETIPGIVGAVLFDAVKSSEGWRDMLRFADDEFARATASLKDSDSLLLRALDERQATLLWLDRVILTMQAVRERIAHEEPEQVGAYLQSLNDARERWLLEREQNEWREDSGTEIESRGFMEHFLGRRGGKDR